MGRIRIYDELSAQVRKVREAGIRPSHLDTHKHTHLLPPVLDAVARIASEFQIRWVRRPFDLPLNAGGARPGNGRWSAEAWVSRARAFIAFSRAMAAAPRITLPAFN